jgi:hypothetical protein
MVDLQKEIIFRDGITLENGVNEMTESFLTNVGHECDLGRKFGLSLDRFEIDAEVVYFEWRGTKRDMLRFYTYVSKNMTTESPEIRKATQKIILSK